MNSSSPASLRHQKWESKSIQYHNSERKYRGASTLTSKAMVRSSRYVFCENCSVHNWTILTRTKNITWAHCQTQLMRLNGAFNEIGYNIRKVVIMSLIWLRTLESTCPDIFSECLFFWLPPIGTHSQWAWAVLSFIRQDSKLNHLVNRSKRWTIFRRGIRVDREINER